MKEQAIAFKQLINPFQILTKEISNTPDSLQNQISQRPALQQQIQEETPPPQKLTQMTKLSKETKRLELPNPRRTQPKK
jgi:hypothetical protein